MANGAKYERIMLKLSGEALQGEYDHGIDPGTLGRIVGDILAIKEYGCEVAIVIGGGNFYRGRGGAEAGMDKAACDYMGMMATVINAIALQETFIRQGHEPDLFCSFEVGGIVTQYERRTAQYSLSEGKVVIIAGGTGRPFFTTDTAAAIRGLELGCDVLLKASHVDGVYNKDPETNPDAKRFDEIDFREAIELSLKVMDQTAFSLCWENRIPIIVFDIKVPGNLQKVAAGDTSIGSLVK